MPTTGHGPQGGVDAAPHVLSHCVGRECSTVCVHSACFLPTATTELSLEATQKTDVLTPVPPTAPPSQLHEPGVGDKQGLVFPEKLGDGVRSSAGLAVHPCSSTGQAQRRDTQHAGSSLGTWRNQMEGFGGRSQEERPSRGPVELFMRKDQDLWGVGGNYAEWSHCQLSCHQKVVSSH